MSFTTGMLAKAQETYANALSGKMTRFAGRRLEQHGIAALRAEITHWQAQVDAKMARVRQQVVWMSFAKSGAIGF
jgi:hypothetical protein